MNFIYLALIVVGLQAKEIALTFDDAPSPAALLSGFERSTKLVRELHEAGVNEVAFFVITENLDREGLARLSLYSAAGHVFGNHTHSHPDLDLVGSAEFVRDVGVAHRKLKGLDNFKPWFRFPYLHEGSTGARRDLSREAIARLGYFNSYMTVKHHDVYMDELVRAGVREGRVIDESAMRELYAEVMIATAERADALARQTLGRSPKHVLLLHENDLAAQHVGHLVRSFRSKGWRVIAPTEAYADEIALHQTAMLFASNPGRVGELAFERGWRGKLTDGGCDQLFRERRIITTP